MRLAYCGSFLFLFIILFSEAGSFAQAPPPPTPKLEIKPVGETNGKTSARVDWEFKNLGKLVTHGLNPVVELKVAGLVIPDSDYYFYRELPKGYFQIIKPAIPEGKHKVRIKLRMDDNSIIEAEADVVFKK